MAVQCFLIEPDHTRAVPEAFVMEEGPCGGVDRYHRATHVFPEEPLIERETDDGTLLTDNHPGLDHPVYATLTTCDRCSHEFTDAASRSGSVHRVWRNPATGEEHTRPHEFGPGAMWDAYWMPSSRTLPDGRYMVAILPNGQAWHIDGPARNCTRPNEPHQCWVREGEPPNLTVGKGKPGESCSAGAGSIQAGDYHGFLRGGVFT